jgi:SNF2 family DNA or RNA helicase
VQILKKRFDEDQDELRKEVENSRETCGKVNVCLHIIQKAVANHEKVVIFSDQLTSLDILEYYLLQIPGWTYQVCCISCTLVSLIVFVEAMNLNFQLQRTLKSSLIFHFQFFLSCSGFSFQSFVRMDTEQNHQKRADTIRYFEMQVDCHVMLITKALGGQGLNLFCASRVILLDVNWNPAKDIQAIYRLFRIGQTKKVFAYR